MWNQVLFPLGPQGYLKLYDSSFFGRTQNEGGMPVTGYLIWYHKSKPKKKKSLPRDWNSWLSLGSTITVTSYNNIPGPLAYKRNREYDVLMKF